MRVCRGPTGSVDADRVLTEELVEHTDGTGEPALRVWYPTEHVAFGRRDATTDGYDRARRVARARGYPTVERAVGGRAVAFTGDVLAFVLAEPADATDPAIDARYEETMAALVAALSECGASVERGEHPDSFCPGTHSLQADRDVPDGGRGKIAGLAQRVRREVAIVGGAVVVRDADAVADVLAPVYDAIGVPFDRESVGSIASATDDAIDQAAIRDRIEAALVGNR